MCKSFFQTFALIVWPLNVSFSLNEPLFNYLEFICYNLQFSFKIGLLLAQKAVLFSERLLLLQWLDKFLTRIRSLAGDNVELRGLLNYGML